MSEETSEHEGITLKPIPEGYRALLHQNELTCTFSCEIGRKELESPLEIISSNINANVFSDSEKREIIDASPVLSLARKESTFTYNLILNEDNRRIYRCSMVFADFEKAQD